jgi:osmotically-inducible protein OsmY
MANYNRAQRGSRTYWPSKESSSRGSNYGDRYHTDRHSENSDWNERRSGNEYYHPENSRYERMNEHQYDSNQNDSSRYDREDDYRNQGNSRNKNSRIPYDRDFNSNYYGNRSSYRGGSYEGGYGNSGYDNDRSREYRSNWNEDLGYNNPDRSRRNREDGGYGGMNYGSGNYGAYSTNYNRYRSENDDERNWWDKSRDEVSSWFGDEDAERRRDQDRQRSGQHRGKGPKGYKRSDERIKEDISDRLGDDPYIDATEIEIVVANGDVTLIGSVNDRIDKRRAEDLAERVTGVQNVENRIRVRSSEGIFGKDTGKGVSGMSSPAGSSSTYTSRKTNAEV